MKESKDMISSVLTSVFSERCSSRADNPSAGRAGVILPSTGVGVCKGDSELSFGKGLAKFGSEEGGVGGKSAAGGFLGEPDCTAYFSNIMASSASEKSA